MAGKKLGTILVDIAANSAKLVQGLERSKHKLNSFAKSAIKVGKFAAGAFAAVQFTRITNEVSETIDKYRQLEGRLKLVTRANESLTGTQNKLFDSAQSTRSAYADTVDLYTRLARSTKQLNVEQSSLIKVTEAINQAIVVSGTSAASAQAAIFQLGQGLSAGALRGEELNSVMEQTPRLAQAIADGLGVTIGQLRELGKQGKLTSETVVTALLSQSKTISDEYSQMPTTVAQSFTQLTNELEKSISSLTGFNDFISHSIDKVTEWLSLFNESNRVLQGQERINALIQERNALLKKGNETWMGFATGEVQSIRLRQINDEIEVLRNQLKSDEIAKQYDLWNRGSISVEEFTRRVNILSGAEGKLYTSVQEVTKVIEDKQRALTGLLDAQAKLQARNLDNTRGFESISKTINRVKQDIDNLTQSYVSIFKTVGAGEQKKIPLDDLVKQEQLIRDAYTATELANDSIAANNARWQANIITLDEYRQKVQSASDAFKEFSTTPFQPETQEQRDLRLQQIQEQRLKEFEVHRQFNEKQAADAKRKADELAAYEFRVQQAKLAAAGSFFGSLAALVGQGSKKQFEWSKRLARVQTIINTYAGAQAAYKDTPGPSWVRAAAAAAAVTAGLARLAAINRTSFSSASASAAATGAGTFTATPPTPIAPTQATQVPRQQTVVNIVGNASDKFTFAQVVEMAQRIHDATEQLDIRVISRNSRNAQDIADLAATAA